MKSFLLSLFSDGKGTVSSKRVSGILCVLALIITLLINTISCGGVKPSESLVNTIGLLAFGCLGLTSTEAIFGKVANDKTKNQSPK